MKVDKKAAKMVDEMAALKAESTVELMDGQMAALMDTHLVAY